MRPASRALFKTQRDLRNGITGITTNAFFGQFRRPISTDGIPSYVLLFRARFPIANFNFIRRDD